MNRLPHDTPSRSSRRYPAPTATGRAFMRVLALIGFAFCGPAMSQLYAPSSRLAAPAQAAPAADVCAPVPQGQGNASEACRRECARNPQYSPSCAKPTAPNWGAPVVGAPAAAPLAQPAPLPASPASRQFGDGSVRTLQGGNTNSGAMKYERPVQPGTPQAAPALPAGTVAPTVPASDANRGAAKIERPAVAPMSGAAPGAVAAPAAVAAAAAPAAATTNSAVRQPAAAAPAATPAQTPVRATGGTLTGSAPPGGLPVQAPSNSASTAAANANAPGKVDAPKFDRAAFDVDFGQAYSGEQVRRTVVLNTSALGEAEFSLTIANAPGFAITEVRVMGQGVTAPPTSTTQAPLPSNAPRPLQDMAARKVTSSVKAPPWKVQFNGPSELQIDVIYAPKLDLINNAAGKKMGVLNAGVRNPGGASGASIALRADFQGATLQPIVVAEERDLVAILGETSAKLPVAITPTGQKGVAVVRLVSAHPGIVAPDVAAQLSPGKMARVTLSLALSPVPIRYTDDDLKRHIKAGIYPLTIEASGEGFRVQVPMVLEVLSAVQLGATISNCDGQVPAYFKLSADLWYDVGSRNARCVGDFLISQSSDWLRKAGALDWTLYFGHAQLVSRSGWSYPGGEPQPKSRTFKASCGELTRDQYIRSYRRQDPWRLVCTPHAG